MKQKNLQKYFYYMMTSALLMSSCITAKRIVPVTYAFVSEVQFGTIQPESDDKGQAKRDSVFIIYAEATRDSIQWENVIFQNREYAVFAQQIESGNFEVGFLPGNEKATVIKAENGHILYQLQLKPTGKLSLENQPALNSDLPIIHFRYKQKGFKTSAKEPVYLIQHPPV